MKGKWVLSILSILFLIGPPSVAAAAEPVSVVLSLPAVQTGTRTTIVVTIKNDGDVPVTLNKYFLPFNWDGPLPNSQFDVSSYNDHNPQKYGGDWDYVADMPADAFIQVGAHATLSGTIDLWKSYIFDTQVDTRFTVQYSLQLGIVPDGAAPDVKSPTYPTDPNRPRTITSNVLQINVDPWGGAARGTPAVKPLADDFSPPEWRPEMLGTVGYAINDPNKTCNPDQASQVLAAYTNANQAISASIAFAGTMFDLSGFNPSKPASISWVKWFGTYNGDGKMPGQGGTYYSAAGTTVATMRAAQYATEAHSGITYFPLTECGCPAGTGPEVAAKARGSYHLLLCNKFFALKEKGGPNSRALTLYHELTHFRSAIDNGSGGTLNVLDTADYRYTEPADLALARDSQTKAIRNAETYEKFAIDAMKYYAADGW